MHARQKTKVTLMTQKVRYFDVFLNLMWNYAISKKNLSQHYLDTRQIIFCGSLGGKERRDGQTGGTTATQG